MSRRRLDDVLFPSSNKSRSVGMRHFLCFKPGRTWVFSNSLVVVGAIDRYTTSGQPSLPCQGVLGNVP